MSLFEDFLSQMMHLVKKITKAQQLKEHLTCLKEKKKAYLFIYTFIQGPLTFQNIVLFLQSLIKVAFFWNK